MVLKWLKNIGKNTLYYPGCLSKSAIPEIFENYKQIFNKLGVDFILLPNAEVCCGLPVLNAGYRKDARKLAEKNFELFKQKKIKKIITNCPSCYHMFNNIYPELLHDWNIEVEHATVTILNALKRKGIDLSGQFEEDEWQDETQEKEEPKETVFYHDPCHLGRYSEIYDEPREVIRRLGAEIIERHYNKEKSFCCGGGGGLRANFPQTAKAIAKKKVDFIPRDAQKIVSPCGLCYANFKTASEKSEEFSTFVLRRLGELK